MIKNLNKFFIYLLRFCAYVAATTLRKFKDRAAFVIFKIYSRAFAIRIARSSNLPGSSTRTNLTYRFRFFAAIFTLSASPERASLLLQNRKADTDFVGVAVVVDKALAVSREVLHVAVNPALAKRK